MYNKNTVRAKNIYPWPEDPTKAVAGDAAESIAAQISLDKGDHVYLPKTMGRTGGRAILNVKKESASKS